MKPKRVHPTGTAKRSRADRDSTGEPNSPRNDRKRLRRLPHLFSCVLELPFGSDADVTIEERPEFFRFVAETGNLGSNGGAVRAHAVEIIPGLTKIVVRNAYEDAEYGDQGAELFIDKSEMDVWRFRFPSSTRTEMVAVENVDGELIVTVPKAQEPEGGGDAWRRS